MGVFRHRGAFGGLDQDPPGTKQLGAEGCALLDEDGLTVPKFGLAQATQKEFAQAPEPCRTNPVK